jgi:hypothetical protein
MAIGTAKYMPEELENDLVQRLLRLDEIFSG